jgi:hypothetical protein
MAAPSFPPHIIDFFSYSGASSPLQPVYVVASGEHGNPPPRGYGIPSSLHALLSQSSTAPPPPLRVLGARALSPDAPPLYDVVVSLRSPAVEPFLPAMRGALSRAVAGAAPVPEQPVPALMAALEDMSLNRVAPDSRCVALLLGALSGAGQGYRALDALATAAHAVAAAAAAPAPAPPGAEGGEPPPPATPAEAWELALDVCFSVEAFAAAAAALGAEGRVDGVLWLWAAYGRACDARARAAAARRALGGEGAPRAPGGWPGRPRDAPLPAASAWGAHARAVAAFACGVGVGAWRVAAAAPPARGAGGAPPPVAAAAAAGAAVGEAISRLIDGWWGGGPGGGSDGARLAPVPLEAFAGLACWHRAAGDKAHARHLLSALLEGVGEGGRGAAFDAGALGAALWATAACGGGALARELLAAVSEGCGEGGGAVALAAARPQPLDAPPHAALLLAGHLWYAGQAARGDVCAEASAWSDLSVLFAAVCTKGAVARAWRVVADAGAPPVDVGGGAAVALPPAGADGGAEALLRSPLFALALRLCGGAGGGDGGAHGGEPAALPAPQLAALAASPPGGWAWEDPTLTALLTVPAPFLAGLGGSGGEPLPSASHAAANIRAAVLVGSGRLGAAVTELLCARPEGVGAPVEGELFRPLGVAFGPACYQLRRSPRPPPAPPAFSSARKKQVLLTHSTPPPLPTPPSGPFRKRSRCC